MSTTIIRFPDFPNIPDISNELTGDGFLLVDFPGWWDGTDARLFNESRPDGDGDFEQSPVFGGARFPIVIGKAFFTSEADLYAARRPLAELAAYRGSFTIEVESLDGIRSASVVRSGRLSWDMSRTEGYAEFELPLKAADPRKYGPVQSLSTGLPVAGGGVVSPVVSPFTEIGGGNPGRVVITNNGSTDTFPILRVTGGLSDGVELVKVETGERLRLEWPLSTANVAVFDTAEGQVWLDDQSPVTGYLTVSQWWSLAAGETATIQFVGLGTPSGTPTLTVEWRDADA